MKKNSNYYFLDVGLLNRNAGIAVNELLSQDILLINQGAIAEQLVGQELIAYQDCYEEAKLYYWCREEKGSLAEVDYVLNVDSQIIPVEVKSGKSGRFEISTVNAKRKEFNSRCSYFATSTLQLHENLLSVPFYLIGELKRLAISTYCQYSPIAAWRNKDSNPKETFFVLNN